MSTFFTFTPDFNTPPESTEERKTYVYDTSALNEFDRGIIKTNDVAVAFFDPEGDNSQLSNVYSVGWSVLVRIVSVSRDTNRNGRPMLKIVYRELDTPNSFR